MTEYIIQDNILEDIADAIREKNNSQTTYYPSEMAAAIQQIDTSGYPEPTGTVSITQNGTANVKDYASAAVNVPNSYAAGDEGKVVSNGALVSQTTHATVTQNGTIDTTLNNSVEVNVPLGSLGYTLLEYIQSDGTQLIDTGIIVPANTEVYAITTFQNALWTWPFGASTNTGYIGYQYEGGSHNKLNIWNGGSSAWADYIGAWNEHPHGFILTTQAAATASLCVFGIKTTVGIKNRSAVRFYRLVVGDNIIVPARRTSDQKIGLYNTTTNEFYTDALNGNPFIAGKDIITI